VTDRPTGSEFGDGEPAIRDKRRIDPETGKLRDRDGTSEPVRRTVAGGPGPSIVDLPAAGCWRLALTWSGHTDTMDLVYRPPTPPS
jgi:hypothetical protein